MKSDLDALMQSKNLDALLVIGNASHNPPMYYLTGGGHVSAAALIKKRGEPAVLFHQDMERDEAAKSGLKCVSYSTYPYDELLKEADGDPALAAAFRYKRIFTELGLERGRVGLYGHTDVGSAFAAFEPLRRILPDLDLVGETRDESLFMQAMETKDEAEVKRIRRMGKVTTTVVGRVAEYLTSCQVREDEVLLKEDRSPLTIGDVKSRINLWLAELGAENPEGTIFAIGRDSGVPHSTGTESDLLRLCRTIVFDIYPCEAGGGYFYDFTRTWSLGYATPEAQKLYDEVKAVVEKVVDNLDLNAPFKDYQKLVCEEFERNGHKTPLHTDAPVKPGVVMTIEPGLYYPEKGMGVRIEDSFWVNPDGKIEILADYPYDFVLKMKNWKKK